MGRPARGRSLARGIVLLAASVLAACGAPASPPRTFVLPVVEPPPPPRGLVVGVTTSSPPLHLALDGDPREWGSLAPRQRPRPTGAMPAPSPIAPLQVVPAPAPPPPPPLPPDVLEAASHVAVALSPEAILVAGTLDDRSFEGVWLGLGTWPSSVPNLDGPAGSGLRGAHAAFVEAHERRFRTAFLVGRGGVRVLGAGGTLEEVPGARVVWREAAKGWSFEASLPIAAMPRVAEAPVSTLRLVARGVTSDAPPSFPAAAWATLHLPAVVSFEPHGALRAAVFGRLSAEHTDEASLSTSSRRPPGLSYHPTDPDHVESLESGPGAITRRTHPLHVGVASMGDVEVGRVEVPRAFVAVSRAGRLVDLVDVEDSDATSAFLRGRDLFVYSPISAPRSHEAHGALPRWSILAVSPEGQIREAIDVPENDPFTFGCTRVTGGSSTADQGLATLHSVARCVDVAGVETPITATYHWDAQRRLYRGSHWRPIEPE